MFSVAECNGKRETLLLIHLSYSSFFVLNNFRSPVIPDDSYVQRWQPSKRLGVHLKYTLDAVLSLLYFRSLKPT